MWPAAGAPWLVDGDCVFCPGQRARDAAAISGVAALSGRRLLRDGWSADHDLATGPHQRCHSNPAVSFAFRLEAKLAWRDTLGYVLAQSLGAVLGAWPLLVWGATGHSVQYGASTVGAGVSTRVALAGEVLATGALVLAIFIAAAHARTRQCTPWTLPSLFAWLVWWQRPWSGASTNPARGLGPALLIGQWSQIWIYVLGPPLRAALAIAVLRYEMLGQHRVQVARQFHFS
jgi:aquaporin Z